MSELTPPPRIIDREGGPPDNLGEQPQENLVDTIEDVDSRLERARKFGRETISAATSLARLSGERVSDLYREKVSEPLEERRQEKTRRHQDAIRDRANAPTRPLNDLRTDDTEILGSSHKRSAARRVTRGVADISHGTYIKVQNAEKPRDDFLKWRQARLLEKAVKLDGRPRLAKRKEMYEKRAAWRGRQLDRRNNKRKKRTERLRTANDRREERYQEWVDYYVDHRINKLYHREVGRLMKERGISPRSVLSTRDRYEFFRTLPENKKRSMIRKIILDVREDNIRKGKLDPSHQVPADTIKRSIRKSLYHRMLEK